MTTDGERWTLAVLAALRAGRFRPRAWHTFLAASFERARDQRGIHLRAHRQVLALGAIGGITWGAVALTGHGALSVAGTAWLIVLLLMVDWHLGMLESADGRALGRLGLANVVTIVRGASLPVLFVLDPEALAGALVGLVALDVLDGVLARGRGESTRLGAWLDGSLDTLLVMAFVVAATSLGAIPGWLAALVLTRTLLPWLVVAWLYFLTSRPPQEYATISTSGPTARLPSLVAAIGLGLALLEARGAVPLAAIGVGASFYPWLLAVVRSRRSPAEGEHGVAPSP